MLMDYWNSASNPTTDGARSYLASHRTHAAGGGRLTAKQRHALPASDFALPGGRYPIENESHGRNALARAAQHASPAEQAKIRAAVHRKYPDIGKR